MNTFAASEHEPRLAEVIGHIEVDGPVGVDISHRPAAPKPGRDELRELVAGQEPVGLLRQLSQLDV